MQQQVNSNMTSDRNQLSDKELHYIKDYMSWELLAMKKCQHAAESCQNPEIQTQIRAIGKTHTQHYGTLLSHLQ
ncbi:MAG: hypothetical protein WD424_06555 [Paenibacillaceae bacterium]